MKRKRLFALVSRLSCPAFLLLAWGCQPASKAIAISPARVVAGVGNVTLHVSGNRFKTGMSVRVGGRTLAATCVSETELTCSLPRDLLLPRGTTGAAEEIPVCVLDSGGERFSETACLALDVNYSWTPVASFRMMESKSAGPRLLALPGRTLAVVGRSAFGEFGGVVSTDSGSAWSTPRLLRAGIFSGRVQFVSHPQSGVSAITMTDTAVVFLPLLNPDGTDATGAATLIPRPAGTQTAISAFLDPRNGLHLAWLDSPRAESYSVHYSVSTDGGATWSAPVLAYGMTNPQPGQYVLTLSELRIVGADGAGKILVHVAGSYHYRTIQTSVCSWDGGASWTSSSRGYIWEKASLATSEGALLGGNYVPTPYYPRIQEAALLLNRSWAPDGWQSVPFQGSDWDPQQTSYLASVGGDSRGNLLVAALYHASGSSPQSEALFRSLDSGTTWLPPSPKPSPMPGFSTLSDLLLDAHGNAFLLFFEGAGTGFSLFRAPAWSD